jgi:hypothetical protein
MVTDRLYASLSGLLTDFGAFCPPKEKNLMFETASVFMADLLYLPYKLTAILVRSGMLCKKQSRTREYLRVFQ